MKEEALKIFYEWDIKNIDIPLDKDEFKKIIGEDNDAIIDPIIRDLKDDGLIEIMSTVGTFWRTGKITAFGRHKFSTPYTEDFYFNILISIRDFDYLHMNNYMSKSKLKEEIKEHDNRIDYVLRDLEYNGYIEILSSIDDKYKTFRITKHGRDYLKERNI